MSTASIFICYRRKTNAAVAGRLHDNLARHFGTDEVFLDVDTIQPGRDFVEELDERVSKCTILLVLIGPDWLSLENKDGQPRIFDPEDYVHIEVKGALKRGIQVVPILVDGATLPGADELPPDLEPLARRQAVQLPHDRFVAEVDTLASSLKEFLLHRAPQKLKLHALFFSFDGRIARKEYWKAIVILYTSAIAFAVILLALSTAIFFSGSNDIDVAIDQSTVFSQFNNPGSKITLFITAIPFVYSHMAISAKRFHDFNLGFKTIFSFFIFTIVSFASYTFSLISVETFDQISYVSHGIVALMGVFPGTPGENHYGPDPLGAGRSA